jgi:hypothetical protein
MCSSSLFAGSTLCKSVVSPFGRNAGILSHRRPAGKGGSGGSDAPARDGTWPESTTRQDRLESAARRPRRDASARVFLAHAPAAERLPAAVRRAAVRDVHLPVRAAPRRRRQPRAVPRHRAVRLRLGGDQRLRRQPALALGSDAGPRPGRVRHPRHQPAHLGQRRARQRRRQPAHHHRQRARLRLLAPARAGLRGRRDPCRAGHPDARGRARQISSAIAPAGCSAAS